MWNNNEAVAPEDTGRKFPYRLHDLLSAVERDGGLDQVISWQPHGRCFKIHDAEEFSKIILPRYYEKEKAKKPKFSSFLRNLNLWGFQRLYKDRDKGCYYHEFFVRSHRSLCSYIRRKSVNGNKVRRKASHIDEPDFYVDDRNLYCYFSDKDLDDEGNKREPLHLSSLRKDVNSTPIADGTKDLTYATTPEMARNIPAVSPLRKASPYPYHEADGSYYSEYWNNSYHHYLHRHHHHSNTAYPYSGPPLPGIPPPYHESQEAPAEQRDNVPLTPTSSTMNEVRDPSENYYDYDHYQIDSFDDSPVHKKKTKIGEDKMSINNDDHIGSFQPGYAPVRASSVDAHLSMKKRMDGYKAKSKGKRSLSDMTSASVPNLPILNGDTDHFWNGPYDYLQYHQFPSSEYAAPYEKHAEEGKVEQYEFEEEKQDTNVLSINTEQLEEKQEDEGGNDVSPSSPVQCSFLAGFQDFLKKEEAYILGNDQKEQEDVGCPHSPIRSSDSIDTLSASTNEDMNETECFAPDEFSTLLNALF